MLVHSCLFVLLSLMSHNVYICTVLFEQINDDDEIRHHMLPEEPVKPDVNARRSSQLAMYSLYKLNSSKFKKFLLTYQHASMQSGCALHNVLIAE